MSDVSYRTVQLKNYNRILLLNLIRRRKFVTKAELSGATGLTFMAIKKIMEELLELNLVREDAYTQGGVGRKAVTYGINEAYSYTLGLHINILKTCAAVMDLGGNIIAERCMRDDCHFSSQHEYVERLIALLEETISLSGVERGKLLGLGIGLPGPVNSTEGLVLTPPNFSIIRFMPIKRIMEEKLAMPVFIQKDTNAIAFGEYWHGAGQGYENLVYIDADIGIGSGIIVGGEIHEGAHSIAGEFGHITLDLNGPRCNCGNTGCLEAMGSGIAILRDVAALLDSSPSHELYGRRGTLTMTDILCQAEKNDALCISVLNRAAYYMGVAINTLINVLDPQCIIIGGILAIKYPQYLGVVKSSIFTKHPGSRSEELILSAHLASRAGVIGAGELVTGNFFSSLVGEILSREQV